MKQLVAEQADDWETRRERELNRVTKQDLPLEDELDLLLAGVLEDDDSAEVAREALETAATGAKVLGGLAASVSAPPLRDPAKQLVEHYYFPDVSLAQIDFKCLPCSDQARKLKELLGTARPYHQIREEYCTLSLAMNEHGETPPKFRHMRPLPRRTVKASFDDTLMMRDRQVIDMHWLHCRGKRDVLPDRTFAEMFVDDQFDIDLAAVLAEKPWTAEIKTGKILNLIPYEELQMAILHTKGVADAWRNAENSMKGCVDRRLREQLVSTPSLKPHVEDFKRLWLADKMVGKDGLAAIAQMHAWLSGKTPLATTTLSEKLRRMRRRTAARGSRA